MNNENNIYTGKKRFVSYPQSCDLHTIEQECDACGTGFVVHLKRQESFEITGEAITMLIAMDHRGGRNADPETGDGVGVTFSIPHSFFQSALLHSNCTLPEKGLYGVGNIFFPQEAVARERYKRQFESVCDEEDLEVLHWRDLRTYAEHIGIDAQACEPYCVQVFVKSKIANMLAADKVRDDGAERNPKTVYTLLERQLYLVRKRVSHYYDADETNGMANEEHAYICSLSSHTIVYKGMLTAAQLPLYYDDLQQSDFKTYMGMMHSRFSTNTFPSWDKAQPFRMMSHNGEINTIYGNIAKMNAREGIMQSHLYKERLSDLYPVIEPNVSDSAAFDNAVEFLYQNGYSLPKAICMMIPEAWQHNDDMDIQKKSMYQAFSCVMDPWDGPACITFTDGRYIGVVIDRNGLRPSRYYVTNDDKVIMASEFGVLDIDPSKIIKKDRLQPGKVFLIDTKEHRIIDDEEIKSILCTEEGYESWIAEQSISFDDLKSGELKSGDLKSGALEYDVQNNSRDWIHTIGLNYGYTEEDKLLIIKPLVENEKEPLSSMGNDVPLACLSEQPRVLYDYFKQWFAQVTNPPIDSIRERDIMSIGSFIGPEGNLLHLEKNHTHRLWLPHPILSPDNFKKLVHIDYKGWRSRVIDITYDIKTGSQGMCEAIERIKKEALQATKDAIQIIILSDKKISETRIAVSTLLVASATHHYLVDNHARSKSSIIVASGEPREVHHFCMLIGCGVDAIYPSVVWGYAFQMFDDGKLSQEIVDKNDIVARYEKATDYGICKVMAKMGISTIDSYKGTKIFEAVGLGKSVIDECFTGTISRIGGIGFEEIYEETKAFHMRGFPKDMLPDCEDTTINLGNLQWRKEGHKHMWDPESIALLQHAVRYNKKEAYQQFAERQNHRSTAQSTIRGLLKIKHTGQSIPLEEVESSESIMKRFASGAMSFGSISLEAHETLAIAMNRIGGKSNSGEGGEIASRYTPLANGDSKRSAVKQVASGRFGVTIEYLNNASEIQIKMAQGAKPGEGGELPGRKVQGLIASTRHATEGIGLISPPPHHDIYSIEDLAELIYDLKNANPQARISVKLVSKAGVGIIAAGVAKTKADHILISGHDGGTGASPITSIKHAGLPWELGIAEAHQVLVRNNLRSRVVLQTDGQLKTGRDICIAAMFGAEEFCFATSTLIAMGCIMMRKCEKNTCPVGIATQDEELRKKFAGSPEQVERFMRFMADDVRSIMAQLGIKTIDALVGRTDLLETDDEVLHWKTKKIDLSALLGNELGQEKNLQQCCSIQQEHGLESVLDKQIIKDCKTAIEEGKPIAATYRIKNTDRATCTMLSHEIAKKYGLKGLDEGSISLCFRGHAGQSFGAFLSHGITATLIGDGNDYAGKGLSGGIIAFIPPEESGCNEDETIIVGSVVLYGAITGKAFFRGRAAERFCIRNSGAKVVVEGVGSHACEYMTGGRVIILGSVEHNFASGMSGGIAFVWDKEGSLEANLNTNTAHIHQKSQHDIQEIYALVREHYERTRSKKAAIILDNWEHESQYFCKVVSPEYQRIYTMHKTKQTMEVSGG